MNIWYYYVILFLDIHFRLMVLARYKLEPVLPMPTPYIWLLPYAMV